MQKTMLFLIVAAITFPFGFVSNVQAGTSQNSLTLTGTVGDSAGEAIIGASVILKGTSVGTVTNLDGRFELKTDEKNPELQISYVGFKTVTVKANGNTPLNIVLEEDSKMIDEVVVVGYGTQKRTTMSSAVAQVKGEQLSVLQAPRLSTSIGGMVSGVITFQASGAPGADAADIYVRGNKPLILVDGVERPYDRVNKDDIESVSVLKDAAAVAPYGLQGANGVILITTKRGADKTTVNYNGEMSWQKPMNTPSFLSSADYFELQNKAYDMEGTPGQKKSDDEIALYRSGVNRDRYPNTDWAGNYMKTSPATKHNISVSAGNDKIKAFASLGYVYQGSMFDGQDYRRYTARANMDIQATKTTQISFDNSFTKDILARTGLGADQIMERIYFAVPYEVDRFSNGKSAFQQSLGTSLYEAMYNRGYYNENNDITTMNISIDQQLPFILKGLSGKVAFNYDKQHKDAKTWTLPLSYYNLGMDADGLDTFERVEQTVKPSLGQEYKR
ncbi:MAG: SusC/RagA family TonB-linked outer membrane protein, partial [Candidatus Symbiothrix sp.]|nr:SusC/RagA family TonB-linked outer membrane protein [Candidatus Symbiothrix sp.]